MNIDPFFDINVATSADKSIRTIDSRLIGFFLCSFDLTNGLQILFSSPYELRNSADEQSILRTHCIWKLEKIPLRIDLKVSEFVYSAFQLHSPTKEEISATTDEPLYGGVLKLWKASKPIAANVLLTFKTKLEAEISTNLYLLYKRNALVNNPIKKREYNEIAKKALEVEKSLKQLWIEFEEQVNTIMESFSSDIQQKSSESLPEEKKERLPQKMFKDKITMRKIATDENPNQVMVILVNQSEDLKNVKINVSKKSEFFSETLWEQNVEEWPLKEDLILEFSKSDIKQEYLIKISSNKATVTIKSLEINKLMDSYNTELSA